MNSATSHPVPRTAVDRRSHLGTVHKLADLAPYIAGTKIIGVVIAKGEMRTPTSGAYQRGSRGSNGRSDMMALRFVLRDSVVDAVNVLVRGSSTFVKDIFCLTEIGDVVIVDNPDVLSLNGDQARAQYLPVTTSDLILRVREGSGAVTEFCGDRTPYANFARIPSQPDSTITQLRDILALEKSQLSTPCLHNIVGIVKQVGSLRKLMKSGGGGASCVMEVNFVDESLGGSSRHFAVEFWGATKAYRPMSWPIGTVVLITSVTVRWDDYRRRVKGTVGDRCIVTVDPISRRGNRLLAYLPHAALLKWTFWDPVPITDPTEVKGKFVQIEDFYKSLERWILDPGRKTNTLTAWVAGTPAGIDMSCKFVRRICVNCKRSLWRGKDKCSFKECCFTRLSDEEVERITAPLRIRPSHEPRVMLCYNFGFQLIDEKTSLRLQITGNAAREALRLTEEEFEALDEEGKKEVIEDFAFEEFSVLVRMRVPLVTSVHEKRASVPKNLSYSVLKMERLSPQDARKRREMMKKRAGMRPESNRRVRFLTS